LLTDAGFVWNQISIALPLACSGSCAMTVAAKFFKRLLDLFGRPRMARTHLFCSGRAGLAVQVEEQA
jgi:hypothetical protein